MALASKIALRQARSTPFVVDQFLPEFWERSLHPNLGLLGTLRYRFGLATLTSLANLRLRLKWDTDTKFDAVVEDRFRLLNAMINLYDVPPTELVNVVTEPLAKDLPVKPNKVKSKTPIFRVVRVVEKPRIVQSRIFYVPTPDKSERYRFSQITMRLITEQSPVRCEDQYPVDGVGFIERKAWLPAARPRDGRIYYYDPKSKDRTYRPVLERFTPFPLLQANRGTFGNTGRVIDINKEKKLYQVENYVVLERRLTDPQTNWRIHHF